MKLYTLYTPSHETLLMKYFLPSFNSSYGLDLVIRKIPQYCNSGEYMKDGWISTMLKKVEYHIASCEENYNQIFAYSDCDVQFFVQDDRSLYNTLIEELGDYDIACQDDVHPFFNRNTYCAGFFVCKSNDRVLNFFHKILHDMIKNQPLLHDQQALNNNLSMLKHKMLSNKFFTHAQKTKKIWTDETDDFTINNDILVHHANWTHGIQNKIRLLEIVRDKYENFNYRT
jgi:Nucleotide-diphospho-sugar transferase